MKLNTNTHGRTNEFILKQLKWISIEQHYRLCVAKVINKLLNSNLQHSHFLSYKLTNNRTIQMIAENKTGPKPRIEINDNYTTKSFIFRAKDIYNRINRKLTLLKDSNKLKKCITKFTIDPNITFRIPVQTDYIENPPDNPNNQYDFSCS